MQIPPHKPASIAILALVLITQPACKGQERNDDGDIPAGTYSVVTDPAHLGGIDSTIKPEGKLAWKTEIGMTGILRGFDFTISQGRIYVVSLGETIAEWERFIEDPPKDEPEGVYCLDAATGDIIWHRDVGEDPFSTVLVQDGKCYLYGPKNLFCLSAGTGEPLWIYPLSGGSAAESPALSPGTVFIASGKKVVALPLDGGDPIWETTLDGSRVKAVFYDNGSLYAGCEYRYDEYPGYLYRLDAATGDEIWRFDAGEYADVGMPAVADGRVYVTEPHRLYCLSEDTGEELWLAEFPEWDEDDGVYYHNPLRGRPCVAGGKVFIGRDYRPGDMYCVDAETGELIWKARPFPNFADGTVKTSPACADGQVYFGSSGWKVETEGGHRTNTFLSCLSADDGSVVWNFEVDGQIETTPVVSGGRVYFGSEDGFFYCLE